MSKLALFAATALCAATPALAAKTDVLIGLDSKITYTENGQGNVAPGQDAVLVLDISTPTRPRIRASLPLVNSLLGPPTNLQITPDGRYGLVANSVNSVQDGAAWKNAPDNKLYVIDLAANPPKLVDTVTVGSQPSGLAINRAGTLALIANRAGKSVSVLSISGGTVKQVAELAMPDQVAAVAITPDGKRAFALMNLANKVAVLAIDGTTVTTDKTQDIPTGPNPYNVDVTPDGKYAIVECTGGGGLNADVIMTITAQGPMPHAIDITTAGNGPEGFAIAPNGKYALAPLLLGTGNKQSDPSFVKKGEAVLLTIAANGHLQATSRLPLGALPEGIAWSADSQYAYVGNYIDKTLQVFRVLGGKLVRVGAPIPLPGQPASVRGVAR